MKKRIDKNRFTKCSHSTEIGTKALEIVEGKDSENVVKKKESWE